MRRIVPSLATSVPSKGTSTARGRSLERAHVDDDVGTEHAAGEVARRIEVGELDEACGDGPTLDDVSPGAVDAGEVEVERPLVAILRTGRSGQHEHAVESGRMQDGRDRAIGMPRASVDAEREHVRAGGRRRVRRASRAGTLRTSGDAGCRAAPACGEGDDDPHDRRPAGERRAVRTQAARRAHGEPSKALAKMRSPCCRTRMTEP